MQKTLVLLKPDAVKRGLVGKVTARFEKKGLKLTAIKMMQLSESILREHYSHIADKPFFPGVSSFMQSAPVVAQCWEGKDAVQVIRTLCGVTNAREAAPGTIRGDLSMSMQCNVVHASEDETAAQAELERFFDESDFFNYDLNTPIYSNDEIGS
jgi:nucleoside-diphosphate kinase